MGEDKYKINSLEEAITVSKKLEALLVHVRFKMARMAANPERYGNKAVRDVRKCFRLIRGFSKGIMDHMQSIKPDYSILNGADDGAEGDSNEEDN